MPYQESIGLAGEVFSQYLKPDVIVKTLVALLAAGFVRADLTYTETVRSEMAEDMKKLMSAEAWARSNQTETREVIFKGDRSANIGTGR